MTVSALYYCHRYSPRICSNCCAGQDGKERPDSSRTEGSRETDEEHDYTMSEYCRNCEAALPKEASVCAGCGRPVSGSPTAPRQPAATERQPPIPRPEYPRSAPRVAAVESGSKYSPIKWALGIAAALFAALLFLVQLLLVGLGGPMVLLVGVVLGVLLIPLYVALALWLDRYEKEPLWMLVSAFVWGAAIATFFSIFFNEMNRAIVSSVFGDQVGEIALFSVSAPLVEETSKGLALFILYWWKKDEFDGVVDGVIYGSLVGLGFTMTENFAYYGRAAAEEGISGSLLVFFVFRESGFFAHSFFTGVTGLGLGLARQSNKGWVKVVAPVAGLIGAMILHSMWNSSAQLGPVGYFGVYFLIMLPAFVGLLVVVAFSLRREGRIVRHYLIPELQSGLLTRQEYDALGSVRGRLYASFRAFGSGGFRSWRARSRFNQAASELAFHRNRVQRGITSVNDARREAGYIQILQGLRPPPPGA